VQYIKIHCLSIIVQSSEWWAGNNTRMA